MTLKPVSDLERKFLARLGESAAQHQAQVLLKQTVRERNSTSKLENVHAFNREVEKRLVYSEPSSVIAERLSKLEEAKQAQEADSVARARAVEWVPEAYVLFIRHSKCLSCGHTDCCLDHASLFIRCRPLVGPKDDSRKMYLPTKVLPNTPLPRLMESRVVTLPACEACFEEANTQCQDKSSSPQVDIASSPSATQESGSEVGTSSSTKTVSITSNEALTVSGGFILETASPSDCESSSPSPFAPATESPSSPTEEEQEAAQEPFDMLVRLREAMNG